MAFLFDEDFESYAIGATLPLGVFTGNGGNVQNFGDASTKCYGGFFTMTTFTAANNAFSICISFLTPDALPAGEGLIYALINENPSNPLQSKVLFSLVMELDKTLSCLTAGSQYLKDSLSGQPLNTGVQRGISIEPNLWYFISIIFDFEEDLSTHNIIVNASFYLNGQLIMSGFADSGINKSNTYTGSAQVNKFEFTAASLNGSFIDNITADLAGSIFPHPSLDINRFARVSAGTFEFLQQPSDELGRVSQGTIELLQYPTDEKARVSAGVIELITKPSNVASGWIVKEC